MATIDYKQKIKDYMNSSEVDTLYKSMLNNLFPELAESEDERIRKEMMTYLSTVEDKELIPYESWITWLEKQGEHANFRNKIQSTWKPSDEQMQFLLKYAEQNNYDGRILTSLYKDLKKLKQ